MCPADRLRQAVAGYPLEVLSDAISAVLHMELVGARLVAVWALEGPADAQSPAASSYTALVSPRIASLVMGIHLVVVLVLASTLQVPSSPRETGELKPLFDGTSLDGWEVPKGKGKQFVVSDGVLRVTGDSGWLLTTQTFDDFVLTFEARQVESASVGGVLFDVTLAESRRAYELRVANGTEPAAFFLEHVDRRARPALDYRVVLPLADREWHRYELECSRAVVRLLRDGSEVGNAKAPHLTGGRVGLHAVRGVVEFRAVNIQVAPPPPPLRAGVALGVSGDVASPRPVQTVKPQYTGEAMRLGQEGEVWLRCIVEVDGRVEQCVVTRSLSAELDAQALLAAMQWTFEPATRDGTAVPVFVTLQMTFTKKKE